MAFTDILESIGAASEANLGRSQLATLVRAGIEEGVSGNAMLSALRGIGSGIRRQSFLQLVGEVRSAAARAETWAQMPLDQMPSDDMVQIWHGGAVNTFLHRVYVYYRSNEFGIMAVARKGFSILSRTMITPAQALARAQDIWESGSEGGTDVGQTLLGMEFGGVYHQLGST
jgi:hypothetical protein